MRRFLLLTLVVAFSLSTNNTYAEIIELNSNESKINYTLSYLGIPIKKKFVPVKGLIDIEKVNNQDTNPCNNYLLKKLNLKAIFTSKNKLFRKTIDYNQYPYFTFLTSLDKPVEIKNQLINIEGIVSFHGVDKKITIKLKNSPTRLVRPAPPAERGERESQRARVPAGASRSKRESKQEGNSMCLIGFLNIKMSDFGIKPPGFLFFKMDNLIRTKVEIYTKI